jgi:hypothetical protein
VTEAGVPEECGSTSTVTLTWPVKQTTRTLRQRVNEALFADGLRLRGNNLVELWSDGPLPRWYRPGCEPIYEANVELKSLAQTLGVAA